MKFKVWDSKNKEWYLEPCFLSKDGYLYGSNGFGQICQLVLNRFIPIHSTETHDKNNIELYQGDLFYSITGCLVEIVWDKLGWGLKYITGIRATGLIVHAFHHLLVKSEKIGSKFENPELLET